MPTQYPTLSQNEQQTRWTDMAKSNLYPYMFNFTGSLIAATFPRSTGTGYVYLTIPWQADNNLSISDLEVSFSGTPLRPTSTANDTGVILVYQVSYAPDLNVVTGSSLADSGNIIYSNYTSYKVNAFAGASGATLYGDPVTINDYHRYEPYNYLVKFNQIVYIHFGLNANSGALPAGGVFFASVIFHCLDTGLKS